MSGKSRTQKLKKLPVLKTNEEAERFVDEADLSEYDLSGFKTMHFEVEKKDARLNMRLPGTLLAALKASAKQRGIPYQRFVREALEKALGQ